MTTLDARLQASARVMRIIGWGLLVSTLPAVVLFPNGFLWGGQPLNFPVICFTHPPSPLDALHPYLIMMVMIYVAWAILLIRGAGDPIGNKALFDFGILANLLHALSMIPMAFIYPNETAHLYMDIPLLLAFCAALWYWHPSRLAGNTSRGN